MIIRFPSQLASPVMVCTVMEHITVIIWIVLPFSDQISQWENNNTVTMFDRSRRMRTILSKSDTVRQISIISWVIYDFVMDAWLFIQFRCVRWFMYREPPPPPPREVHLPRRTRIKQIFWGKVGYIFTVTTCTPEVWDVITDAFLSIRLYSIKKYSKVKFTILNYFYGLSSIGVVSYL